MNRFILSNFTFSLGHDVTAVMPFKEKNANYKIILSDPEQIVMKKLAEATESVMTGEDTNPINTMIKMLSSLYKSKLEHSFQTYSVLGGNNFLSKELFGFTSFEFSSNCE